MNLLDLLIIVLAIGYAIGGFRSGAVVGLLSMLGFFGGAAIGMQLAEPLGKAPRARRCAGAGRCLAVLLAAMRGQLLGVWAATRIRGRLVPASARSSTPESARFSASSRCCSSPGWSRCRWPPRRIPRSRRRPAIPRSCAR